MLKVMYVCTHNRCRSILSEAITQQKSDGNIIARSAGSAPSGHVHPLTLQYLEENGYRTEGLYSKSLDELAEFEPDIIITLCDSAANEPCPVIFNKTLKLHWGLVDPSQATTNEQDTANAFNQCIAQIEARVATLVDIVKNNKKPEAIDAILSLDGIQVN